ncbi:MAG TPA: YihY/virulence factor BrkB family protein [Tepidisphaeraceae bacterium]|nr:YihY/virulence factor BrkB family protein [Tepidisphaeraceae bacterium]
MAALRELPVVLRTVGAFSFVKKVWDEIQEDNLFTWASALAYSWLFAVFPFFLVLLSLIPLLKHDWRVAAREQLDAAVNQLPHEAKVTVKQYVDPKLNELLFARERKSITSILSIGLLATIWAASGGMAMTMSAMDRTYDVTRARPFYKQRPLAVMLTVIVASLILAVVILIPVGTAVTNYVTTRTQSLLEQTGVTKPASAGFTPAQVSATAPTSQASTQPVVEAMVNRPSKYAAFIVLWQVARYGLGLMFMFWVVSLIFYFGPNVRQRFRVLTPGSVFTVAMWVLLGTLFRVYVDTWGSYGKTYGTVGGVIILLFFFYLYALLLLIGAEINAEVDCAIRDKACMRDKPPPARETVDTEPAVETP